MSNVSSFEVSIASEQFERICAEMNRLAPDLDAIPTFDGMSGGFKFHDEVPSSISSDSALSLPLITVLRILWGYRTSLVQQNRRNELEPWWIAVKNIAPNWPGFQIERCSISMLAISEIMTELAGRLSLDLDKLDMSCESRSQNDIKDIV